MGEQVTFSQFQGFVVWDGVNSLPVILESAKKLRAEEFVAFGPTYFVINMLYCESLK